MKTIEEREDAEDAKDAEEARQEPGERVTLEEYIDTREPVACQARISILSSVGPVGFDCEMTGTHSAHMARGEEFGGEETSRRWKLVWEVQA